MICLKIGQQFDLGVSNSIGRTGDCWVAHRRRSGYVRQVANLKSQIQLSKHQERVRGTRGVYGVFMRQRQFQENLRFEIRRSGSQNSGKPK